MLRERLLEKINALDEDMVALFAKLRDYGDDDMNRMPDDKTWSPKQVLQHLILSEKLSLAYCKKKLSFEPTLKRANFRTWINGRIISWALISPFKFGAPAAVRTDQFSKEESLEILESKWLESRTELVEFMATVPDEYIDKEVYKHPFGMRISLSGMLDFYKNHFRRHRKQIFRRL